LRIHAQKCNSEKKFGIAPPATFRNDKEWNSPVESELWTASNLCQSLSISGTNLDWLITTGSLPRKHQAMMPASIIKNCEMNASFAVEMSGNCATILSSLHYATSSFSPSERGLILCIDSFKTSYQASSEGDSWKDGGGALLFDTNSALALRVISYASTNNPSFLDMAHRLGEGIPNNFTPHAIKEFKENDLRTEMCVIEAALEAANTPFQKLAAIVPINRSAARQKRLAELLNFPGPTFSSREDYGHRGGSDLIFNLGMCLESPTTQKGDRIALVGNGLGYSWGTMILEIA
jgi:3-oxoacyl-[acyl-carrier-protein] synthase III